MTDKDDLSGQKIGEFVLRERIGEGGFGAVYCSEQPMLGREVVVKVLRRNLRQRNVIVQRFMREAQLASRLDHPYAAHIYGFGIEQDRVLWIAMERVQGVTLAEWIKKNGPMPLGLFVPFFERIAAVVQTAHERGIVHRDLKPSNVMVIERAGELLPKLLDFGVAKLIEGMALPEGMPAISSLPLPATDDLSGESPTSMVRPQGKSTVSDPPAPPHPDDDRLTQNNHTVGSPQYMSPEQWNNSITVGPESDLYALAVVAFEAVTGRRPFEAATVRQYAELHRRGLVPALGGNFPPALDQMFQRALAKRPEDRWSNARELARALRAASGIDATRADVPRIEHDVRDAWLAEAPQPLAEAMAKLDDAHNAYQARDLADGLLRTLLRYLLAMTLAMSARVHEDDGDPALLELARALISRELGVDERVQLLRLLVRRLTGSHAARPVPELIALLTPKPDGTDELDPILALYTTTEHAVTAEMVGLQLMRLIPALTQLFRKAMFLLEYVLVVPRNHAAERWTGQRCQPRALANVSGGELVDGRPILLDRTGQVCLDLWPLVQAVPPLEGAATELFLFDGHGRRGALLIAAPSGLERHDPDVRGWVVAHVLVEIEAETRVREQLRLAARQWQNRDRPNAMLWRGEVLADFERWARRTNRTASLGDLEAAFVAMSRRVARRTWWIWRLGIAAAVATAIIAVGYYLALKSHTAEQIAEQAEVEQGRQALLHDDLGEALQHLTEAYRRGDFSWEVAFMLARALQPRMAEQARFVAAAGRMWSAAFSPDGQRVVTSDDRSARVWDARTNQLLFTLPHGDTVYDAHYSTDGTHLVTASGDGSVGIWDAASGVRLHELRHEGKPSGYFAAVISPDSKLVAAIDTRGAVAHVWDAGTGAQRAELRNSASDFRPSPSVPMVAGSQRAGAMTSACSKQTRGHRCSPSLVRASLRSASIRPGRTL